MTADAGPAEARGAAEDGRSVEERLRHVATARRLLVVSDFDGTLAPIVAHPDAVSPDLAALEALRSLSRMRDTSVAILSGRARAVLVQHLGVDPALTLVGSHGAEFGDAPAASSASAARRADVEALVATLADELDTVARAFEGSLVERKPAGVAFHYRQVPEECRERAAAAARAVATDRDNVRVQPGHLVVELVTGSTDKGDAIAELRRRSGATATIYVGDDQTDEHAFARLDDEDLAVRVGAGDTAAPVRLPAQADVAPLFERLRGLRAAHVRPP